MIKNSVKQFLLIDDDELNNYITKRIIKKIVKDSEICEFIEPEIALAHIENDYLNNIETDKITILLDINMPTMTGWEFLKKFETFNEAIINQFNIYMLSSSVDPVDIERAKLHPLVIDFIEKPLEKEILIKLFG